jgi:hypothetical protein
MKMKNRLKPMKEEEEEEDVPSTPRTPWIKPNQKSRNLTRYLKETRRNNGRIVYLRRVV